MGLLLQPLLFIIFLLFIVLSSLNIWRVNLLCISVIYFLKKSWLLNVHSSQTIERI